MNILAFSPVSFKLNGDENSLRIFLNFWNQLMFSKKYFYQVICYYFDFKPKAKLTMDVWVRSLPRLTGVVFDCNKLPLVNVIRRLQDVVVQHWGYGPQFHRRLVLVVYV